MICPSPSAASPFHSAEDKQRHPHRWFIILTQGCRLLSPTWSEKSHSRLVVVGGGLICSIYIYIYIGAGKQLIASKIKVFVYIICVCVLCIFITYT